MHSRQRTHNNKQSHKAAKSRRPRNEGNHTTVRSGSLIIPSEFRTRLKYVTAAGGFITNAGSNVGGQRWHTNAPYDVDPILGSTAMPGYAELAALAHFVRAMGYRWHLELVNNESFPVTVLVTHTNNDLGTTGLLAPAQQGNPLTRNVLLAPLGHGGKVVLRGSHTISQVVGSSAPVTEDNYRSLTNAVPADLTWLGIYIMAGAVNTFTVNKGVSINLQIEHDLKFYGRNVLTS